MVVDIKYKENQFAYVYGVYYHSNFNGDARVTCGYISTEVERCRFEDFSMLKTWK